MLTYEVDIAHWEDPKIDRLIAMGERNPRIRIRKVDKSKFAEEARLILNLLNEAWSDNWGYVPLTEAEIAYAGKKLKPIIFNELVRVAEVDGEPVAFMLTIPDINELIRDLNGELFPFNFIKLLWRLRKPRTRRAARAADGRCKKLHHSRLASQLAFMMIEYTRRDAVTKYGATHGEFGWILEDNKGMLSIAELPGADINHRYRIYEKAALALPSSIAARRSKRRRRPLVRAPSCARAHKGHGDDQLDFDRGRRGCNARAAASVFVRYRGSRGARSARTAKLGRVAEKGHRFLAAPSFRRPCRNGRPGRPPRQELCRERNRQAYLCGHQLYPR